MDLCFKNDVRENVFAQLAFTLVLCAQRTCFTSLSTMSLMVAVIISGDDMDAFILFKKVFFFFDKCFTSELHIMEQKPWGHNLNTPAPQLTRKKGKKWAWLAAEESTLPILSFAQHHPDIFPKKEKKCIQSFPAVGKTQIFSSACRETLIWMTSCSLLIGWRICSR